MVGGCQDTLVARMMTNKGDKLVRMTRMVRMMRCWNDP